MKFLFLLTLLISQFVFSQVPCIDNHNGYFFPLDKLNDTPPLSLSMPYDVLLGYIAFDSVAHYATYSQIESYLNSIQNTDTIKLLAKHFNKMTNYDPLLLKENMFYYDTIHRFKSFPSEVRKIFTNSIKSSTKFDSVDKLILISDGIYKIRISDVKLQYDSSAHIHPESVIVTCQLTKKFKGDYIPLCNSMFTNHEELKIKNFEKQNEYQKQFADSGDCFQFTYSSSWVRGGMEDLIFLDSNEFHPLQFKKENGEPWAEIGKDYLVFVRYYALCGIGNIDYNTAFPSFNKSFAGNFFPINEIGIVKYSTEFGYPNDVNVELLENLIINKLNLINNYQLPE